MRLYIAVPTDYAEHVITEGFTATPRPMYDPDALAAATADTPEGEVTPLERLPEPTGYEAWIEFRDVPPAGLTRSITTESRIDQDSGALVFEGGPMLADDPGDFVLSIEVPDDVALEHEAREDPPLGWPFREFWLPPSKANQYRDTLKAYDSNDGEEVRLDLVGK